MKLPALLIISAAVLLTGCGPRAEEKAEEARKAAEEKELAQKVELVEICKNDLRVRLKDPQSLRVLSRGAKLFNDVQPPEYFSSGRLMWGEYNASAKFDYTATNSYGGRVRSSRLCLFLDKDLIFSSKGSRDL